MECHTCHNNFDSWELLARHILQEHPYSRGTKWANDYTRKYRKGYTYRDDRGHDQYVKPNWKSTNDPVQIQIINFFAKLYEMQNMGFSDGEIITMVNLGKRKAGKQ